MSQQPYDQYPQYPQGSADYQMQQPAFQLPIAPDGRPLAGPGQRLGARVIDGLAVFGVFVVGGAIIAGLVALLIQAFGEDSPAGPVVAVIGIVLVVIGLQYVYEVEIPLRWNGQTPGKRVLKITIAPLEPGRQLSRGQLSGRWGMMLLYNVLGSLCYVGILDPLWCLWDKPYKQCLHDKPAKTVVVKTVF